MTVFSSGSLPSQRHRCEKMTRRVTMTFSRVGRHWTKVSANPKIMRGAPQRRPTHDDILTTSHSTGRRIPRPPRRAFVRTTSSRSPSDGNTSAITSLSRRLWVGQRAPAKALAYLGFRINCRWDGASPNWRPMGGLGVNTGGLDLRAHVAPSGRQGKPDQHHGLDDTIVYWRPQSPYNT